MHTCTCTYIFVIVTCRACKHTMLYMKFVVYGDYTHVCSSHAKHCVRMHAWCIKCNMNLKIQNTFTCYIIIRYAKALIFYIILIIISFVSQDPIPTDRGRDRGRLSDDSATTPNLIHSSVIRQSQTNSKRYYYY